MHVKKVRDNSKPIYIVVILLFAIGIVLGAVSFFHIPKEFTKDVSVSFETAEMESFLKNWKDNFLMELLWILAVWILSSISFTAPLSGAVLALRGFLIGFSVTFILKSADNAVKLILCNILPQTVIALPTLTIFVILAVKASIERKNGQNNDTASFFYGALFILIAIFTSALETAMSTFFRNMF